VTDSAGRTVGPRAGAVAAARIIRDAGAWAAGPIGPRVGVILGTGLGELARLLDAPVACSAAETGWLCRSTATGHAGRVVCGTLAGAAVAMLQGRVHGYEGFPSESLTRGVELLAALGAKTLLVTNAAGGLRPDMRAGEIVIVTDHVDLVRRPWTAGIHDGPAARPSPPRSRGRSCYDPGLADAALRAIRRADRPARCGVYALLSGPSYETRAEYRMLRAAGADVVGMSTVPEVAAARALGLAVVVCSVVTNVARPDHASRTDAEDVCQAAAAAAAGIEAALRGLIDEVLGGGCS